MVDEEQIACDIDELRVVKPVGDPVLDDVRDADRVRSVGALVLDQYDICRGNVPCAVRDVCTGSAVAGAIVVLIAMGPASGIVRLVVVVHAELGEFLVDLDTCEVAGHHP